MALNVLVIGTGFGKYAARPAYKSLGCNVQLVSPRDEQALARAIDAGCDLVSIHSPPFMHLQHVKLALSKGCHILCDKPLGRNAGEAEEMLELVRRAGVLHFVNFEFRYEPQRAKMKALLDAGAIGTPLHLSHTAFLAHGRQMPHGWLFDKDQGGGWIGAFASHVVDSLHWMFGDIEDVQCRTRIDVSEHRDRDRTSTALHKATAEDAIIATFRMANGVTAALDTAFACAVEMPPQIMLLGSEGSIELLTDMSVILHRPGSNPEQYRTAESNNAMGLALDAWLTQVCESVRLGRQITPDFETGLKCAKVLDRMRAVASEN